MNCITNLINEIIGFIHRLINIKDEVISNSDEMTSNFYQFAGSHNCTPLFVLCRHVACGLQVSGHEYVAHWVP